MIPTARRGWFTRWFAGQAQSQLRATFGRIELRGLESLRELTRTRPVLMVANHSSYWDGIVLLELIARLPTLEVYTMMDAKNLRRLRFFRLAGAYGVDLDSRRDGVRAIRYGATLLTEPGQAMFVFPQGTERPPHEPLEFRAGAARIAQLSGAAVVPIGLRYVFGGVPKPRVLASIGEALADTGAQAQAEGVSQQLAIIDGHLSQPGEDFEVVHESAPGWLGEMMTAALDRFAGALIEASSDKRAALPQPQGSLGPANAGRSEQAHKGG